MWDLAALTPLLRPRTRVKPTSTARRRTIRFDAPLVTASFHPRNSNVILATLACNEAVLVDLRPGGGQFVLADVMDGDEEEDEPAKRK